MAAQQDGRLAEEIIPVTVSSRKGDTVVDTDEHPRADTSLEELAKLKPVRRESDPESTVTAGNSSGQNDGAAVCIVTTRRRPPTLRPAPACPPGQLGRRRRPAAHDGHRPGAVDRAKALDRAGLKLADMDLIELNEAFAAQVLAVHARVGLRRRRTSSA